MCVVCQFDDSLNEIVQHDMYSIDCHIYNFHEQGNSVGGTVKASVTSSLFALRRNGKYSFVLPASAVKLMILAPIQLTWV